MGNILRNVLWVFLLILNVSMGMQNTCVECHQGVEDIRAHDSGMMQAILAKAEEAGAKGNDCVVCHGGNPEAKTKEKAHAGTLKYFLEHEGPKAFYPYPASPWINANTCGMCHPNQVATQENNLMATEQGKIHGALWGFGAKEGVQTYLHKFWWYIS